MTQEHRWRPTDDYREEERDVDTSKKDPNESPEKSDRTGRDYPLPENDAFSHPDTTPVPRFGGELVLDERSPFDGGDEVG